MLVKLLGLPCLTQAFCIISALRGIAALVGPPTAGLLVDEFADPGLALDLCGALMVASSGIACIASVVNRFTERRADYILIKPSLFFYSCIFFHLRKVQLEKEFPDFLENK